VHNIKLILEYDGSSYHGWQKQPRLPTIQTTLEDSLFPLFGERIETVAAGRTDAGVHAKGQVVIISSWKSKDLTKLANSAFR